MNTNPIIPTGGIYMESLNTISRKKLLDYIEHEEIAFQFGDGLMCITHPDGNYGDNDLAHSMAKDVEEMKKFIADCRNISVVHEQDIVSENDDLGFNEFAYWSKDTDLLILIDKSLLLCLPDPDTHDVIFEVA
ncbi:MAG: hypothetical protein IJT28_05590 [Bacteroidaceae bacterium]|nr:hypothetical protein [Bacteroidaceae bacterium]